jgi:predicted GNAT family N-acyltransferase
MTKSEIEQIRPELTWQLRRDILYPGEYKHNMEMEEDNHGYHFGAFKDNALVGVVSLFQNGSEWQFRKFAVSTEVQGMGIGKTLLQYIMNFSIAEGATKIWCNARDTATGFYARYGFTTTGEKFERGGFNYEIMEKTIKPKA